MRRLELGGVHGGWGVLLAAASCRRILGRRPWCIAAGGVPEGFDGDALRPAYPAVVTQGLRAAGPLLSDHRGRRAGIPSTRRRWKATWPELGGSPRTACRYVFKLREGVLSPYGNELTADDVVWSWKQVLRPEAHRQLHRQRLQRGVGRGGLDLRGRVQPLGAQSRSSSKARTLYVPGIYDTDELLQHATEEEPVGAGVAAGEHRRLRRLSPGAAQPRRAGGLHVQWELLRRAALFRPGDLPRRALLGQPHHAPEIRPGAVDRSAELPAGGRSAGRPVGEGRGLRRAAVSRRFG